MEKQKIKEKLLTLANALRQVEKAIDRYNNVDPIDQELVRSAAIHAFEFSLELYWKMLKKILAYGGEETTSPRESFAKAYQGQLIDDEQIWIAMLKDRNITSHTYEQESAEAIFERIQTYYPTMQATYQKLNAHIEEMK